MTYDTWKTTEPEHRFGFICDGCALTFPETDMQWRGGTCLCPKCVHEAEVLGLWKRSGPDDGHQ